MSVELRIFGYWVLGTGDWGLGRQKAEEMGGWGNGGMGENNFLSLQLGLAPHHPTSLLPHLLISSATKQL